MLISFEDGYFLPFYFQAVQGASASESGVRFVSLAISEMAAIVVTGAIVTKIGHYVTIIRLLTRDLSITDFCLGAIHGLECCGRFDWHRSP